jgi:hypothetical protein
MFLGRILHVYCNKEVKNSAVAEYTYKKEFFSANLEVYFKSGQFDKDRRAQKSDEEEDKDKDFRRTRRFQTLTKMEIVSFK